MATLNLLELECVHPLEARTDEVRIAVNHDSDYRWSDTWSMQEGEVQSLESMRGIEFHDRARVQLWEQDRYNPQDSLGSFTLRPPAESVSEPVSIYLPSEIGGPHSPCYRLSYIVEADTEDSRPRNRIELLSLTCRDAQGSKDWISVYVNDALMWGPGWMRRGDTVTFPSSLSIDFRNTARVELRERQGQNWTAPFNVEYGSEGYVINRELHHDFNVDRGIVGDAGYTLNYRLRRLPAR